MIPQTSSSLTSDDSPAIVENAMGKGEVVLVCEHAGKLLPTSIGSLGIDDETMSKHIGWDIGAAELSRELSKLLDAPLVMQRYSRLVIDCNRSLDANDAIVQVSDDISIPANQNLSQQQRQTRHDLIYSPFCQALTKVIDDCQQRGQQPAIVTIHSFTPIFKAEVRTFDLGVLHDSDSNLADQILALYDADNSFSARRNEPYAARDGVTHTLNLHGVERQLDNVMLEVRNNLIDSAEGQKLWARRLSQLINSALTKNT